MTSKIIKRTVDAKPGMYTMEIEGDCSFLSIGIGPDGVSELYPAVYIWQKEKPGVSTVMDVLLVETGGEIPDAPDASGWSPGGMVRSIHGVLPYTFHCFVATRTIRYVD